jgi:hypothetical protein
MEGFKGFCSLSCTMTVLSDLLMRLLFSLSPWHIPLHNSRRKLVLLYLPHIHQSHYIIHTTPHHTTPHACTHTHTHTHTHKLHVPNYICSHCALKMDKSQVLKNANKSVHHSIMLSPENERYFSWKSLWEPKTICIYISRARARVCVCVCVCVCVSVCVCVFF